MQIIIDKPPVAKNLSYVLKTSALKEALEPLGEELNLQINYRISRKGENGTTIFECLYWLPNANINYSRFYITIGTVEYQYKKKIIGLIDTTIIPQFITWIEMLNSLSKNSTQLKHNSYFRAILNNDIITIDHKP